MRWPVDPHLYFAFLGVMAVMAITPGPANLFAVATGVARGRASALLAVVGMNAATLVWFGLAALGLGALVKAFPDAFRLIAVGGALYVAWLGFKAARAAFAPTPTPTATLTPGAGPDLATIRARRERGALVDGFMVQIANPKVVLFFTAVLPPFLDAGRPMPPQMALFALAAVGMDGLSMSAYGLAGAALARRMARPRFRRGFDLCVGLLLFLAAGLIVARL